MKNLKEIDFRLIREGFRNLLLGDYDRPTYQSRRLLCSNCPKAKFFHLICGECGCFIPAKCAVNYIMMRNKSVGGCPLHIW